MLAAGTAAVNPPRQAGRPLYGGASGPVHRRGAWPPGIANQLALPTGGSAHQQPAGVRVVAMKMGGDGDPGICCAWPNLIRQNARPRASPQPPRHIYIPTPGAASPPACPACLRARSGGQPNPRLAVAIKYRLYDHVITISEGIRQVLLASEGLCADKVSCARSAVDATPYLAPVDRAAFCAEFRAAGSNALVAGVVPADPARRAPHLLAALPASPATRGCRC